MHLWSFYGAEFALRGPSGARFAAILTPVPIESSLIRLRIEQSSVFTTGGHMVSRRRGPRDVTDGIAVFFLREAQGFAMSCSCAVCLGFRRSQGLSCVRA